MSGWVFVGWHLDGMSWPEYLSLTVTERLELHDELSGLIERTTVDGSGRPKDFRK